MAPKRVLVRPAAKGAALRRPAARVRPPRAGVAAPMKKLRDVSAADLSKLSYIRLKDAGYYGRQIEAAGLVKSVQMEGGRMVLEVQITGTQDEDFLKEMSGRKGRKAVVHVCEAACPHDITGANYLHGIDFEEIRLEDKAWYSNLQETGREEHDELEALRAEAEKGDGGEAPLPKEKKEKKRRRKEEEKEKKNEKSSQDEEVEPGKKKLAVVFGDTALDPDPKVRGKWIKKARRAGKSKKKKKKKKKSQSETGGTDEDDSSYSDSSSPAGSGLFDSERRMKTIWRRYPGALTSAAVGEARDCLLTTAGTLWDIDKTQIPPLLTHYGRSNILPHMSPAMAQECLTLCVSVDFLLQGRIAACADLLSQRIKALEAMSRGSSWQIARQMELVRLDSHGITDEAEAYQAAKRAREEARLRAATGRGTGSNDGYHGGGGQGRGGKGKNGKGNNNKGRTDDGGRGKQDSGKDDKGRWGKKDK